MIVTYDLEPLARLGRADPQTTCSCVGTGSKPMRSHFGVGKFTTHFRTYSGGDWDVHWGYEVLAHSLF